MNCRRIVSLLIKNDLTLSIAESCTGGLICHQLTTIPGVSAVLKEGIICYSNTSKMKRLGIPAKTLAKYGAVSHQVCHLLARNVVKSESANLGLATTGIAGPTGATPNKPIGLVFIGVNVNGQISVTKHNFKGTRRIIQRQAAQRALELLEQAINNYAG